MKKITEMQKNGKISKAHNVKAIAKRFAAVVLCVFTAASFCACKKTQGSSQTIATSASDTKVANDVQSEFDEYCTELFVETIEDDAISAHFLISDPADYGIEFDDEDFTFGDQSVSEYDEDINSMRDDFAELKKFDREKLSHSQQITYDTLEDFFEIQTAFGDSIFLQNIFAPSTGIVSNLSIIFTEYQFYEKDDISQYLLLMRDMPRFIDQCLEFTRKQSEQGYFMSDKIADKAIAECKKHFESKGEDIISSFEEKLDSVALSKSEKENFIKTHKEYVEKYYLPPFKNAVYVLESLKGTGKNDGGLCNYGETGKKYYSALIRDNTSSDMTAQEVAELLDDTLKELISKFMVVSDKDYSEALEYQPDFEEPEEIVDFLIDNIGKDFPAPVTTNYDIKYMSKTSENDVGLAYYMKCRIDDTSVNNIKINSTFIDDNMLELYNTLAHEVYPGHLYQYTGFFADDSFHDVRKLLSFIGSTEGWSQYAAKCSLQYLDTSSGVKDVIYMNDLLNYVLIARVDVGVNYEGWDIEKVYDYLSSYVMVDDDFENEDNIVANIYYTAVGNAAEYIPYAVGYIKMNNMRALAEKELGKNFDAVKYHEFIASVGITSFDVYEDELDAWIDSQK